MPTRASGLAARVAPTTAPATPSRSPAAPASAQQAPTRLSRLPAGPPAVRLTAVSVPQSTPLRGTAGGDPLPQVVRGPLEASLGADLSAVRVHTDAHANELAVTLSARGVTHGNHIFLRGGEQATDLALMGHEVAHVLQQQGIPARAPAQAFTAEGGDVYEHEARHAASAVVRRESFTVRERTSRARPQRLGISDVLDYFADKANIIPGFRMFTILLGVNPINMSRVDRSAANILRAIIEFIPGGGLITQALDNYKVFDKVGAWVEKQLDTLAMTGSAIKAAVMQFLDSLSWSDIFDLGGVWDRAKRIFTDPIRRIIDFAAGLVTGILGFIKDAILKPLAGLAEGTRGYDLLKAVLGEDPITGEKVPRTAETLIPGFLKLIGQEEIWENAKKSNAIPRLWAWFQGALEAVLGFVRQIPQLAINAVKSLELVDIVLLPRAFAKIIGVFAGFVGDFISWAGKAVWNLLEIIFDVVSPGALKYIKKVGAAFKSILKNPLPFVGNLVKAAKAGFLGFADRFLDHLKAGLIDWLTGSLPGIYIPKAFSLQEIVKFVLSVLGLSWANVRGKLVKAIGEPAVKVLETTFDIVVTLVREGPAAAWDKIKEQLSNLKEMAIGAITDFVLDAVVKKAVPKLIAMFIPGAGFISAIISIYETVMVFVEKIKKIIAVVTAFIDSLIEIAEGAIGNAAKRVESTLAGLLSLAISFLAGFIGLGRVSDKIMGVIQKIRAPIDKAIDWLIGWIVGMAKKLGKLAVQAGVPQDPNERVRLGAEAGVKAVNALRGPSITAALINPVLAAIKVRYGLKTLVPIEAGGVWWVEAEINPKVRQRSNQPATAGAARAEKAIRVGDQVQIRSPAGGWSTYRYRVTAVTETSLRYEFAETGQPKGALTRGETALSGLGKSWRPLVEAAVPISDEELLTQNGGPTGTNVLWTDFGVAKKVLNYRHHIHQGNPPNKDWEHIVERAGSGEHSVANLALTDRELNQRDLNNWFGSRQPSGDAFPSTGPLTVRAYLDEVKADATERSRWKKRAYKIFRVALKLLNKGRGPYQTLD